MLNLGEQVVPLLVFLVFEVVVLIVQVKVHLEICAVVVTCLHQPKLTVVGTAGLINNKSDMPWFPLSQPLEFLHW